MAISKITTSGVSADTLTAADLAPNSVDSSELVDGSIDTSHIGNLQVTAAKVASDVATTAGTQTLTNKTLTAPTLTTPALGTPASGVVTNLSGVLPVGVTGGSGLSVGGLKSQQVFTATATWTKPAAVTSVKVYVTGGGGGGGHCTDDTNGYHGGGGSAGGTAISIIDVTNIDTCTATVGAYGTGRSSSGVADAGGTSSFAKLAGSGAFTTVSATGGGGGRNNNGNDYTDHY